MVMKSLTTETPARNVECQSRKEGPTSKLQFLGIELDTMSMELKLANLLKLSQDWRGK